MTITNDKFEIGPFSQNKNYRVIPELDGYKFQKDVEISGNIQMIEFTARKLSTLRIEIVDLNGNPIPDGLIFLSSTSRKNYVKM